MIIASNVGPVSVNAHMGFTKKTAPSLSLFIQKDALIAVPAARLYVRQRLSGIMEIRVVYK